MQILLKTFVVVSVFYQNYYTLATENFLQTGLEIPCKTDSECAIIGSGNYKCAHKVCMCTIDDCQKLNAIVNAPVSKIGLDCSDSTQCLVENSFCSHEGRCECLENTISSLNNRKCLNVSTYGSPCQEDVQCKTPNSVCADNKCVCSKSRQYLNQTCYNIVDLGSTCETNEECFSTENSACTNNKCTCSTNYVKSITASKCLVKAKDLGSECSENTQCAITLGRGSICSNENCKCLELYQYNEDTKKCVLNTLLGGRCSKHTDCHQPGDGERRLECILGECKCKSMYIEESGFCILSSSERSMALKSISKIFPYILSYIIFYTIL